MTLPGTLALLLLGSPAGMFAGHALAYRVLRAAGRRPTAHTSAFAGIGLCFFALGAAAAWLTWNNVTASWVTALASGLYIVATYAALALLYLDVVNIAETSLHMHLLLEIAWDDRQSLAGLIDKYSPAHMVGARLDRLTALGQVRLEGGHYRLDDRSALQLAGAIDSWRRVIGLPTSPDDIAERRRVP